MNKILDLVDNGPIIKDNIGFNNMGIHSTRVSVEIRKKDGSILFEDLGENASLIGGVQDYVKNYWNIQSSDLLTINNLDSEFTSGLDTPTFTSDRRQVFGFGIGIDGAIGGTINAVKRHSKGYELDKLVAFRCVNTGLDTVSASMDKYALRVQDTGDSLYYIKKFVPEYKVVSAKSKATIPDNPDTNYNGLEDVRAHCRIRTKIEKGEASRWFGKKQGTTDNTHFNSIILFAGRPCTVNIASQSFNTYRDIIACNKINFKTIDLVDTEVIITYDIYFV